MNTVTIAGYWLITSQVDENYNIDQPKCPVCLETDFRETPDGIAHTIISNDTTTQVERVWHKMCLPCFVRLLTSSNHGLRCPICRCLPAFSFESNLFLDR